MCSKHLSVPDPGKTTHTTVWVIQKRIPHEGDQLTNWAYFDVADAHRRAAKLSEERDETYVVTEINVQGLHPVFERLYDEVGYHTVKDWVKEQTEQE